MTTTAPMTEKQERIASKIRKILAIAGDDAASTEEIQNAMAHARRLMDSHHLTQDDLAHEPADDYKKVDSSTFAQTRAAVGKRIYSWEEQLAVFISKFTGSPVYTANALEPVRVNGFARTDSKGKILLGKGFVFYGVEEDAVISAELYSEMRELIVSLAVGLWGQAFRSEGASYAQGFVAGLFETLRKDKALPKPDTTTTLIVARRDDLVKYKTDKASDWLAKSQGIKLKKGGGRPGSRVGFNGAAFRNGKEDGRKAEMSNLRRRKLS